MFNFVTSNHMFGRLASSFSLRPPTTTRPADGAKDAHRLMQASLDEVNRYLSACAEALPQVDVRELQRLLLEHVNAAHPADIVCNRLLHEGTANQATLVEPIQLGPRHRLRSPEYRKAVENVLINEFSGLRRSTIRAVLAENNHSFVDSRETLLVLAGKSWRVAISSWWHSRPGISRTPSVRGDTGCAELDDELFGAQAPERDAVTSQDQQLATELNAEEYEQLLECGCCFADVTCEQAAACGGGHLVCRDCLVQSAQDSNSGTLRCISATTDEPCAQAFARELLEAVLPPVVLLGFDNRAARLDVAQSGLTVAACPFCPFAEFEETPDYRFDPGALLVLWVLGYVFLIETLPVSVVVGYVTLTALLFAIPPPAGAIRAILRWIRADAGAREVAARRRGTRFVCRNPACSLGSCIVCSKAWPSNVAHNCVEDERERLRLMIETAMTNAVKRVCPQCQYAFVKEGGCNKMTCRCGYKMCYRCRADLREEGYEHFCNHFRARGGPCLLCPRCDLYGDPDDEVAARTAAERARRTYISMHGDPARDPARPAPPPTVHGYGEKFPRAQQADDLIPRVRLQVMPTLSPYGPSWTGYATSSTRQGCGNIYSSCRVGSNRLQACPQTARRSHDVRKQRMTVQRSLPQGLQAATDFTARRRTRRSLTGIVTICSLTIVRIQRGVCSLSAAGFDPEIPIKLELYMHGLRSASSKLQSPRELRNRMRQATQAVV
ncbi:hypothetical protein BKA62DRAFT_273958 [Auriculariales sp. MPI-PUGE-AT-0066]|nr:hypothetical protein BKA62DRAFT_273958 [Auriculariales sp. MPI-PUGE-AT-0066]